MSDERSEEAAAEQAKRLFDDSVERLDAATLSRLNRQRHRALAGLDAPASARWQRWLPATGVAAAVAMALLVWQQEGPQTLPPTEAATDLDILLAEEELEMLEELEFYAWLEAEEAAPVTDGHVG